MMLTKTQIFIFFIASFNLGALAMGLFLQLMKEKTERFGIFRSCLPDRTEFLKTIPMPQPARGCCGVGIPRGAVGQVK